MTNMPLGALILIAYNITVRQLSGPPESISEKYDIAAKAEHPVSPDDMLPMLRQLLEDRFKLVIRHEMREVPVYALTLARGGPKLHPSETPDREGIPRRIPSRAGGAEPASGHLIFRNESMPDLAWALSRMAGIGDRVVVDHTGLTGQYDFELLFGPERGLRGGSVDPKSDPSIFSALQEQLGLKLESRKEAVDFLVVDHIEKPSEN